MRPKITTGINQRDYDLFLKQKVIDAVNNTKGFSYNCFINKNLRKIMTSNIKGLFNRLGIWGLTGKHADFHRESDIKRLQGLLDHQTNCAIDLRKVPLHLGVNPNELKAPLIQIPALFNFLNNGSIEYTDACINEKLPCNSELGYGLNNYFDGFNTYYVNPMFFKYGSSIGVCHIPILRYENATDIIVNWINKAFNKKYGFSLFYLHGDTTFEDL